MTIYLHIATRMSPKILLFGNYTSETVKGKVQPRIGHEAPEGDYMYSSTLSLTLALDGVGGQRYAPTALPPGMTRYPLYRRLGGFQNRSVWVRKISPPPGFEPRNVNPVAISYTD